MPRIKDLLASGAVVRLFGVAQLFTPKLVEVVGEHGGFDGLWIDAEHGGLDMKDYELATMAARAYDMDHFVRLPATDYASIMRPLEAGAGGVMVSMIHSPEDADRAVRWAKFWPRGDRGMNGGNRDGRFGLTPMADYVKRGERTDVRGHPDRDGRRDRLGGRDRAGAGRGPPVRRPGRHQPGHGRPRRVGSTRSASDAIEGIASGLRRGRRQAMGDRPARAVNTPRRMRSWGCRMFVLGFDIHVDARGHPGDEGTLSPGSSRPDRPIALQRPRNVSAGDPSGSGLLLPFSNALRTPLVTRRRRWSLQLGQGRRGRSTPGPTFVRRRSPWFSAIVPRALSLAHVVGIERHAGAGVVESARRDQAVDQDARRCVARGSSMVIDATASAA